MNDAGVSPQSVFVNRVDVGRSTVDDGDTQCVDMTLSVLEFSGTDMPIHTLLVYTSQCKHRYIHTYREYSSYTNVL